MSIYSLALLTLAGSFVIASPLFMWSGFRLFSRDRGEDRDGVSRDLERRLEQHEQQIARLSRALLEAQEAEKRKLALELHDDIGQLLSVLKMEIEAGREPGEEGAKSLGRAHAMVDETLEQVRSLTLRLRPATLEEHGLVRALEGSVESIRDTGRVAVDFEDSLGGIRLPATLESVLFRVAQEALTNALRHAKPARISIAIGRIDDRVDLRIEDDGVGFDTSSSAAGLEESQSLGLLGMAERVALAGGRMSIDSSPGEGTRIAVTCPLPESSTLADSSGSST